MARNKALLIAGVVLSAALGFIINLGTELLPKSLLHPLIVWPFLTVILGVMVWLTVRQAQAAGPGASRRLRASDRRFILARVKSAWIDSVFERHVSENKKLPIRFKRRVDLSRIGEKEGSDAATDALSGIISEFHATEASFLILGQPGSGKTIAMLALLRHEIECAQRDDQYPIPLMLSLETWTKEHESIEEWVTHQLKRRYHIPMKVGSLLNESDGILLMLDGLDQVDSRNLKSCLRGLQKYQDDHLTPIVINCRSGDYKRLCRHLKIGSAVEIQPLSMSDAVEYLAANGMPRECIATLVESGTSTRATLQSPRVLSIMRQIGWQRAMDAFAEKNSSAALWREYASVTIERLASDFGSSPVKARQWLSQIACWMNESKESVFLVDRMQPDLLGDDKDLRIVLYAPLAACLAMIAAFRTSMITIYGIQIGDSFSVIATLASWIGNIAHGAMWASIGYLLHLAMRSVLLQKEAKEKAQSIEPVEYLSWSWSTLASRWNWLLAGVCGAIVSGYFLFNEFGAADAVFKVLRSGFWWIFACGATIGLATKRSNPNEAIVRSARMAVISALLVIFLGVISMWPFGAPIYSFSGSMGFAFMPAVALGGVAVVRHITLRLMLARAGMVPIRLVRFLRSATTAQLLDQTGSGFQFRHPNLQEYFAGSR